MTLEELEKLEKESREQLEKAMTNIVDALIANVRIRIFKDMLFMQTGKKSLVDK
jgi:hypothetical protein